MRTLKHEVSSIFLMNLAKFTMISLFWMILDKTKMYSDHNEVIKYLLEKWDTQPLHKIPTGHLARRTQEVLSTSLCNQGVDVTPGLENCDDPSNYLKNVAAPRIRIIYLDVNISILKSTLGKGYMKRITKS